ARIAEAELAGDADVAPASLNRRRRRTLVVGQLAKVAVVARRLDCRAERGVDEPVRPRGCIQGQREHAGEHRRDGDELGGRRVDAIELAVRTEAAERSLELLEEESNRFELG